MDQQMADKYIYDLQPLGISFVVGDELDDFLFLVFHAIPLSLIPHFQ